MSNAPEHRLPGGWRRRSIVIAVPFLMTFAIVLQTWLSPFFTGQLAVVMYWTIAALGLSVLISFTGQLSIGHGAFFAMGAYVVAILEVHWGWQFEASLVASVGVTTLAGALVAYPAARVRDLHFAIFTLAFSALFLWALNQFGSITGGTGGLILLDTTLAAWSLADPSTAYRVGICGVVLAALGFKGLRHSRLGRMWLLSKASPIAAEAFGLSLRRSTVQAFGISALYCGLAGGLYAGFSGIIGTQFVTIFTSISLVAMVVVGGKASVVGPLLGSAFILLTPSYARSIADWHPLITGILLTLVVLLLPGGLVSAPRILLSRFRLLPSRYRPRPEFDRMGIGHRAIVTDRPSKE